MSRAEQFRQDAAQFWSDIDHRKVVVAGHKSTPTRSGGMPTKPTRWSRKSKIEEQKQALIELACRA